MNRHFLRVIACSVLLLLPTLLRGTEQLYTCGMHPQIIRPEPGNCPICGMKLTPVRANATRAGAGATAIAIDAATVQRMNLKTALVERGPVRRELRAVGTVAYDEAGLRDITVKYEGWIERLHVATTWAQVQAGDPLFAIYSPDLYNAQLNYLVARRGEGDTPGPLTRAARARLELFDVPAEFIAELDRTGEAQRTFVYRAPADGVVIEKSAVQGQMMRPGERIYRLADLSTVWVEAQIYEGDLPFVRAGQPAQVRTTYGREQTLPADVSLVLPRIEEQTRTATARLVVPNRGGALRPGMFVAVHLTTQLADSAVLVPDTAVLRSGERNTVFVARDGGTFEPREIELGVRSEGQLYEVRHGLEAGERVVVSGQFMLDSESQLREAIQKMTAAATAPDSARPRMEETPLSTLALAVADLSASLAADDLASYRAQLPALRTALAQFLAANDGAASGPLASLPDATPADLTAARMEFEPLSTAVADLARAAHLHHTSGLHVFECPMSPVLGTGRWLQRDADLKNPFFGSEMLTCGEELP